MSIIEFRNISKAYGSCISCQLIDLDIEQAQIHAIVGENGAGKSTLMKILGGLVKPTTGSMKLRGALYQPDSAKEAFSQRIAFIHQHFVLARHMTALENILLSYFSINRCHTKK